MIRINNDKWIVEEIRINNRAQPNLIFFILKHKTVCTLSYAQLIFLPVKLKVCKIL